MNKTRVNGLKSLKSGLAAIHPLARTAKGRLQAIASGLQWHGACGGNGIFGNPTGRDAVKEKYDWQIFTTSGVTFEERATTAALAIQKSFASSRELKFQIVAVIRADMLVKPDATKPITALVVGNKAAFASAPEGFR